MKLRKFIAGAWLDAASLLVLGVVFIVPFAYILLTERQRPVRKPRSSRLAGRIIFSCSRISATSSSTAITAWAWRCGTARS